MDKAKILTTSIDTIIETALLSPYMDTKLLQAEVSLKSFAFYRPNPKQELFHKLGNQARQRLFLGGNRTGKTYAACVEIAMHLTGIYPQGWKGYRYKRPVSAVCSSVTAQTTRENLQEKFFSKDLDTGMPPIIFPRLLLSKTNQGANDIDTAFIEHSSGGTSKLRFMAYTQGSSVFQGWKTDILHFDEMPSYEVYQEGMIRTTSFGEEPTFVMVTSWPEEGGMTDTLAHFWDNAPEGVVANDRVYVRIAWDDATHMTEDKKKALADSIPDYMRDAREHGIPIFGRGKVFTMPVNDLIVEPFEIPEDWPQVYGLDLSSSSGGTWAAVLLAYDPSSETVFVIRDYECSGLTPLEHAYHIGELVPRWCTGMNDPSGAGENMHTKEKTVDFLKETCHLKLVNAFKGKDTKENTISQIYTLARANKFKIVYAPQKLLKDGSVLPERGCVHLMKEWRQYSRDEKGQILKRNDHTLDALFYALGGLGHARTPWMAANIDFSQYNKGKLW